MDDLLASPSKVAAIRHPRNRHSARSGTDAKAELTMAAASSWLRQLATDQK